MTPIMQDQTRGVHPVASVVVPSGVTTRLSRSDVKRIATLAHLELTEAETERYTQQLGDILTFFEQLQQVDTTDIPPTTHPVTSNPVMRPDTPRLPMPRNEALANAPDPSSDGLFRVPKVIGS
jgi:aspartyl-tRNA(Asn)/glutamyl-tRNA(Gln) amidotransferase subunit C